MEVVAIASLGQATHDVKKIRIFQLNTGQYNIKIRYSHSRIFNLLQLDQFGCLNTTGSMGESTTSLNHSNVISGAYELSQYSHMLAELYKLYQTFEIYEYLCIWESIHILEMYCEEVPKKASDVISS